MAEESIFTDEFLRQLINVGEADILVGVPTYNNAATVGPVVQTIRAGLLKSFPRERAVIVNADGGSRDGTQDLVREASVSDQRYLADVHALRTLHCISAKYEGPRVIGHGAAQHPGRGGTAARFCLCSDCGRTRRTWSRSGSSGCCGPCTVTPSTW